MTNRELEIIMTKPVQIYRRERASRLGEAVWAYTIMHKTTIGISPYELVFGKKVMLPIEFKHKTLRTTSQLDLDIIEDHKERV